MKILTEGSTTRSEFAAGVRHDGYAILEGIFTSHEMKEIAAVIDNSALTRSRAGVRHALQNPAIAALASDHRLSSLAKKVLGGNATPYRATFFDKSLVSNWLVVWHQDTALPLHLKKDVPGWGPWSVKDGINYAHAPARSLEQVLAIRVHLDESDSGNGPLRVLPATHDQGVLTDEQIRDMAKKIDPLDCLVACGGVLLMRPLLVHSSSKSRSQTSRRVLHIEYSSVLTFEGLELHIG